MTQEYKHNKTQEIVPIERWVWGVVYNDNTELHQYDINTGLFHNVAEINQSNAKMFTVYATEDNDNMDKRIDIMLPKGAKIFYFYRNSVLEWGTENQTEVRIFVFGYKYKGVTHYNWLLPNDKLIQSTEDLPDILNYI